MRTRGLFSALLLSAATTLIGCGTQSKVHGETETKAIYSGRTLTARLPAEARVPAVVAAADETFRARGYTVVRSSATEEVGEIIARPPRYNNYPRIVIDMDRATTATVVSLRYEPFGDEDLCRSILDGVLQRMGL